MLLCQVVEDAEAKLGEVVAQPRGERAVLAGERQGKVVLLGHVDAGELGPPHEGRRVEVAQVEHELRVLDRQHLRGRVVSAYLTASNATALSSQSAAKQVCRLRNPRPWSSPPGREAGPRGRAPARSRTQGPERGVDGVDRDRSHHRVVLRAQSAAVRSAPAGSLPRFPSPGSSPGRRRRPTIAILECDRRGRGPQMGELGEHLKDAVAAGALPPADLEVAVSVFE